MADKPRILFIIVNYRRAELCVQFAHAILNLPAADQVKIVIVDNSEMRADQEELSQLASHKNVFVRTPSRNLGFYGGADFGYSSLESSGATLDWIIVCNPDIDFPDSSFLLQLLNITPDNDVGVLAPDIRLAPHKELWEEGAQQNPMMEKRPSKFRLRLLEVIFRSRILYRAMELRHRWRSKTPRTKTPAPRRRLIYAAHGSAIIFAKNYFRQGGSLRHGSFLYGEELFVAEELRLRNLKCVLEPTLHLCHVGGATTGALGSERQRLFCYDSMRFIRTRYFSSSDAKNSRKRLSQSDSTKP